MANSSKHFRPLLNLPQNPVAHTIKRRRSLPDFAGSFGFKAGNIMALTKSVYGFGKAAVISRSPSSVKTATPTA